MKRLNNTDWCEDTATARWAFCIFIVALACFLSAVPAASAQEYSYLYDDEPRITSTWAYRIDQSCPDNFITTIQERMDLMGRFYNVRFLSLTNASGIARDHSWLFTCDADFTQSLELDVPGEQHRVETLLTRDSVSGGVNGRASLWWIGSSIVEVDIQLHPDLADAVLPLVIDHEIAHGSGCAHNTGNIMALMYPVYIVQDGWHHEDFYCFNKLYGPLDFSLLDYLGNVYLPQVTDWKGRSGWAVVNQFTVRDFGENNDGG